MEGATSTVPFSAIALNNSEYCSEPFTIQRFRSLRFTFHGKWADEVEIVRRKNGQPSGTPLSSQTSARQSSMEPIPVDRLSSRGCRSTDVSQFVVRKTINCLTMHSLSVANRQAPISQRTKRRKIRVNNFLEILSWKRKAPLSNKITRQHTRTPIVQDVTRSVCLKFCLKFKSAISWKWYQIKEKLRISHTRLSRPVLGCKDYNFVE